MRAAVGILRSNSRGIVWRLRRLLYGLLPVARHNARLRWRPVTMPLLRCGSNTELAADNAIRTKVFTLVLIANQFSASVSRNGRKKQGNDFVQRDRKSSVWRSEEHTSELQSPCNLVCRLLLEKKKRLSRPSNDHRRRTHSA